MITIKTVTVVGANGTMGSNISGIFASFGHAKVYMVSRDIEKSKQAIAKAQKSVRAESISQNMVPADYSMLDECVRESDLVFESTAENLELKIEITGRIAKALRRDAIACTGSSGLSITRLAECLDGDCRGHYMGIHMFNPPYHMTLCEVISTKYTDRALLEEVKEYLQRVLLRTVVEVKDSPAFLGNRIGFQFINEALQYADRYRDSGGIDYIDAILGPFTGRAMAPLTTADFVGLDVHKAIVDNVYANTEDYAHETFRLPSFVQTLIDGGRLGRKSGAGLYKMEISESGVKRLTVYDIGLGVYRDKIRYEFPFVNQMTRKLRNGDYADAFAGLIENRSAEARLCLEFLLKYVVYALVAANEVGYGIHSADDVMATGFNWCPPLAMIGALSTVTDVKTLIRERLAPSVTQSVDLDALFEKVEPSKYDYRIYFKSLR